jgi:hypothetical protein
VAGGDDNEIHIHLVGDSAGYARDTGTITRVATFPGNARAERDGEDLHVFSAAEGQNPGWREEGNVGPYSSAGRGLAPGAGPQKLATFHGHHFTAEPSDGKLHILEHRDEKGQPASRPSEEGASGGRSSAGDVSPMGAPRNSHHAERTGLATIADLVKLQDHYLARRRA